MYSRVKQLCARGWRDGRTNGDNETTGRLSPSAGSPWGGKTRRLNSPGEPRAREEAATPRGSRASERARESEERTSAPAEGSGRDRRPCNDLTAMVTFLISARFNYTVDEEVLAFPPSLPPSHPSIRPLFWCFNLPVDSFRFTLSSNLPTSPSPRVEPSTQQTRSVVLTRHRLANKIWLIAPERFLRRFLSVSQFLADG